MAEPTREVVACAAERLKIDTARARAAARPAPGLADAWLFGCGGRGAGRLLVTRGLETLWAASGISPERQVQAFRAGMRS